MPDEPDERREPNLELPRLRLPGFRRKDVPRAAPSPQPDQPPEAPAGEQPVVGPEPEPARPPRRRSRRARTPPTLPAPLAAALTGLVVGGLGAGVTYGGLRGCEALNGTPSCGGPGLGYLVAIAVGMVAVGALVLKSLQVAEPVGTSFLAVGILAVVVLVGLTSVIFSGWMFLAIPAVAGASYLLAHWATTRFVDVEQPPGPDVR